MGPEEADSPFIQYPAGGQEDISKNDTLRLVRLVRQKHRAHQAQIAVLDASLRTHFVRTRTLPVRAPQTPPGANPPASSIFSQP